MIMGPPKILFNLSLAIVIIIIGTVFLLLHQLEGFRTLENPPSKLETGALVKINGEPKKPRILCWILTGVENHLTRAIHVKRTWGSRCDILLFMSSRLDENLGTIALPGVEEGWGNLWIKTVKSFEYIWEHHRNEADWFMKADDDTWVFVDNLRSLLRGYDEKKPYYLGNQADPTDRNETYNFGGTGYIVSKAALRLFIQESLPYEEKCYPKLRWKFHGWEDAEFGNCMLSVGVLPESINDGHGRPRFVEFNPVEYILDKEDPSSWERILSDSEERPISYHKVRPRYMYALEYMTRSLT